MLRQRLLEGDFVPLVTPFDQAGRVDVACLERLAAESLDAGAAGIVALATAAVPMPPAGRPGERKA